MRKTKRKLKHGDLRLSDFGHGILGGVLGLILTSLLIVGYCIFPSKFYLINASYLFNILFSILAIITWFVGLAIGALNNDDLRDLGWKLIGILLAVPLYLMIGAAIIYGIPALYTSFTNKMFEKVE